MLAVNANRYWPVEIGGAWHCPMHADCAPFLRCHKLRTDIAVDIVVALVDYKLFEIWGAPKTKSRPVEESLIRPGLTSKTGMI